MTKKVAHDVFCISKNKFRVIMTMSHRKQPNKKAILLASFGTTFPAAVDALVNTQQVIQAAFPEIPVRICFTSNLIRSIWEGRRSEAGQWKERNIPDEILYAKSFLGEIGDLQNAGYRTIVIQPTYIAHGEQFEDLRSYVEGLQSIRTIKPKWMPFEKLVLSRPFLGTHGTEHHYQEDLKEVVSALSDDVESARAHQADLVYVGHGNDFFSTAIYMETQKEFRLQYPDIRTYVGLIEGYPAFEDILPSMQQEARKKLLLKPLMLTAGEHANHDIAGPEEDSWQTMLTEVGFEVIPVLEGFGSSHKIASLFANRVQQTAEEHHIDLSIQSD